MNSSCSPDIKQALQQAPNTRGPVLCLIRCQVLVSPPAISRYHSADSRGGRQKSNLNKYSIFPPLFFHAALYAQTTPPTFFFIYFFFPPSSPGTEACLLPFFLKKRKIFECSRASLDGIRRIFNNYHCRQLQLLTATFRAGVRAISSIRATSIDQMDALKLRPLFTRGLIPPSHHFLCRCSALQQAHPKGNSNNLR